MCYTGHKSESVKKKKREKTKNTKFKSDDDSSEASIEEVKLRSGMRSGKIDVLATSDDESSDSSTEEVSLRDNFAGNGQSLRLVVLL